MTCFGVVLVTFLAILVVVSFLLGLWCSTPPMLAFAAETSGVGAQPPGLLVALLPLGPPRAGPIIILPCSFAVLLVTLVELRHMV